MLPLALACEPALPAVAAVSLPGAVPFAAEPLLPLALACEAALPAVPALSLAWAVPAALPAEP